MGSDPTFKIYTLGCKVNQYDSQAIREQLIKAGLKEVNNGRTADYCIINTCTVTSNADRESRYLIRKSRRNNPLAKVVVTGCYAHSNAEDIRGRKGADLILDNDNKNRILELLFPQRRLSVNIDSGISDFQGHTRAFVKIQDGCDNFCSFCKVPYVRGRSRSRDFISIIEEIKRLSHKGYKEIVLTGICLGDYGKDTNSHELPAFPAGRHTNSHEFKYGSIRDDSCVSSFAKATEDYPSKPWRRRMISTDSCSLVDLISEIEKLDGILRIRLSSIEAKDVSDKLIQKMKTSHKLCPHLHIPFQSGDNKILKLMNRKDTRESYLKLVEELKKNIKDIGISCDIMIGFPGDGENEFLNTLEFLKKIEPMRSHIFCFQPRDLTPLANVKETIEKQELKRRFTAVKELIDGLALKFKKRFLNRSLEVLFEDRKDGFWRGYSQNYLLTCVKISDKLNLNNQLVKVSVNNISISNLYANL